MCTECGAAFPTVGAIPCLMVDAPTQLDKWRRQGGGLLLALARAMNGLDAELRFNLLPSTRERLVRTRQGNQDNQAQIRQLLERLSLTPNLKNTPSKREMTARRRLRGRSCPIYPFRGSLDSNASPKQLARGTLPVARFSTPPCGASFNSSTGSRASTTSPKSSITSDWFHRKFPHGTVPGRSCLVCTHTAGRSGPARDHISPEPVAAATGSTHSNSFDRYHGSQA